MAICYAVEKQMVDHGFVAVDKDSKSILVQQVSVEKQVGAWRYCDRRQTERDFHRP